MKVTESGFEEIRTKQPELDAKIQPKCLLSPQGIGDRAFVCTCVPCREKQALCPTCASFSRTRASGEWGLRKGDPEMHFPVYWGNVQLLFYGKQKAARFLPAAGRCKQQTSPVFLEALLQPVISCFPPGLLKIGKTNWRVEDEEVVEEEEQGRRNPSEARLKPVALGGCERGRSPPCSEGDK